MARNCRAATPPALLELRIQSEEIAFFPAKRTVGEPCRLKRAQRIGQHRDAQTGHDETEQGGDFPHVLRHDRLDPGLVQHVKETGGEAALLFARVEDHRLAVQILETTGSACARDDVPTASR